MEVEDQTQKGAWPTQATVKGSSKAQQSYYCAAGWWGNPLGGEPMQCQACSRKRESFGEEVNKVRGAASHATVGGKPQAQHQLVLRQRS